MFQDFAMAERYFASELPPQPQLQDSPFFLAAQEQPSGHPMHLRPLFFAL